MMPPPTGKAVCTEQHRRLFDSWADETETVTAVPFPDGGARAEAGGGTYSVLKKLLPCVQQRPARAVTAASSDA